MSDFDWPPRLTYEQQLTAVHETAQRLVRFQAFPHVRGGHHAPPTLGAFTRRFRQHAYRRWAEEHPVRALEKA